MTEQTEQEKIIRALRAVSKAGSSDINCLARRAVDEIERLRAANAELERAIAELERAIMANAPAALERMKEVERLRAALQRSCIGLLKQSSKEIERLRTALRNVLDDIKDYERINNLAPNPPRTHCWDSVAWAYAVLDSEQSGAKAAPLPAEVSATEHSGQ